MDDVKVAECLRSMRCPTLIRLFGASGACFTSLSWILNVDVLTLNCIGTIPHPWVISEAPGVIPSITAVSSIEKFCWLQAMCKVSILSHKIVLKSTSIAARCVVTVVDKILWESQHDSHTVTIQWVHVVMDPLLPECT